MNTVSSEQKTNWLSKQVKRYEEDFFGVMPMMMVAQSCLGSISAMYALKINNIPFLVVGMAFTMVVNSAFIAQIKSKWAVVLFGLSIIVNVILIVLSAFFHFS